ncbi:urea ABC transporter, permease protein UrtC [Rubidibacter lacunae KORDI 51-2]|uniref:Urea ABC transporter, permease protein UrtC n=1 Tax=Rubidibacter lacunae KORDI 51-2 TaxID=582515 RepID=U5DHA6_9CHRO|nr:urea ABC transporter permease subunit UrtC [Rubidibacter lacunae]ERN39949.1 urea ABC transporter, permease protein UrtC [Rubidibacter lacunae KORDI 51-2]
MLEGVTLKARARKRQQRQRLAIEAIAIAAIVLVLIFAMPALLSAFRLKLLGRFLALAIVALGIDLIWGYTGLLSLGHGIFFALGGYALTMHINLQLPEGEIPEFFTLYGVYELPGFWEPFRSFPIAAIAAFLVPAVVAGLLGYLVFRNRIRGVYFSILTQAALLVFFNFFNGQQKLINGTNGLKTDTDLIFGVAAGSDSAQFAFYVATVLFLTGTYLLCRWLTSGRFGQLLIALRDDESRVRFSGYNPTGYKVLVFAVSGAIAGIAGALYSVQSGIITPAAMEIPFSIEMVIWVAVGGRATLVGPILGAVAVNYAESLLSEQFPEIWSFFQGALFLIVVTVLPQGVVGWVRDTGWTELRSRITGSRRLIAYPEVDANPVVQKEREEVG